jgi:Flp pilus assembly protein TadG
MKRSLLKKPKRTRRGIIAVLSAVLLIIMLAMVAFAVDVGYIGMLETQLQTAADSAALAAAGSSNLTQDGMRQVAQAFAQYHKVAGRTVMLNSADDIQFGTWDPTSKTFSTVQDSQLPTAVKVTVKVDAAHGGNASLFFGRALGRSSVTSQASAVAVCNPRDICFVVDLSSSMHFDTTPGMSTANTTFIQTVYDDLGFGTYPGTAQKIGAPLGAARLSDLTSTSNSPLLYSKKSSIHTTYNYTVPNQYLIYVTGDGSGQTADTSTTRTTKAYSWVIDEQLGGKSGQAAVPGIMKTAVPLLDSTISDNYSYWQAYISNNSSSLGCKSYVTMLMNCGRDGLVGSTSQYSIMSINHPNYHKHAELTDGGTFNFPLPEMPTHAVRRAIIAALKVIADRNETINNPDNKDKVSLVVFDKKNTGGDTSHVRIVKTLTDDYAGVMDACTTLQACVYDGSSCTDSEGGLIYAYNHIKPGSQGGSGREMANKVVVFLTDGDANLYESSTTTIGDYMDDHPGGWGSSYAQNGALMQSSIMQGGNWCLYSVGVGGGCKETFMDQMAVKGGTAIDGHTYAPASDASTYETTLKGIFEKIISNPRLRLVQ